VPTAPAKESTMYEPNTPQAEAALRTIAAAFNRPGSKADHLKVYNRALAIWRERPGLVSTIWVYTGYGEHGPEYRPLEQRDFTDAVGKHTLYTGHTYRVYVRYTRTCNVRRFYTVIVQDADALSAPFGFTVQIGTITL